MRNSKSLLHIYLTVTAWVTAILAIFAFVVVPVYETYEGIHNVYVKGVSKSDNFTITKSVEKAYINVLMVGLDKDETRTDVIMIAQYNFTDNTVKFLHIPRDTYVEKRGDKKINSSYGAGGIENTIKDIEKLVNIDIEKYVIINISGFREVIDEVGGVDFDVPQRMKYTDKYQDLYIDLNPGFQHLDGDKAEQLVRFRSYPEGDLKRIEVQISFIKEAMKQISAKCKNGEADLSKIISSAMGMVTTNFTTLEAGKYAPHMLKTDVDNVKSVRLAGEARNIKGISYFVADDEENERIVNEYFTPNNTEVDFGEVELRDKALGNDPKEYLVEGIDLGDGKIKEGTTVDILDFSGTKGASLKKTRELLEQSGCKVLETFVADTITTNKTYCITADKDDVTCPIMAKMLGEKSYYHNSEYSYNASVVIILGKEG
ncbi:MAG: LCP family protein [Clostridia bacterium]|nr:LCP family protein [Clostridia bacterium]